MGELNGDHPSERRYDGGSKAGLGGPPVGEGGARECAETGNWLHIGD